MDDRQLVDALRGVLDRPIWSMAAVERIRSEMRDPRDERSRRVIRQLSIAWRLRQLSRMEPGRRSFIHRLHRRVVTHLLLDLRDLTSGPAPS